MFVSSDHTDPIRHNILLSHHRGEGVLGERTDLLHLVSLPWEVFLGSPVGWVGPVDTGPPLGETISHSYLCTGDTATLYLASPIFRLSA